MRCAGRPQPPGDAGAPSLRSASPANQDGLAHAQQAVCTAPSPLPRPALAAQARSACRARPPMTWTTCTWRRRSPATAKQASGVLMICACCACGAPAGNLQCYELQCSACCGRSHLCYCCCCRLSRRRCFCYRCLWLAWPSVHACCGHSTDAFHPHYFAIGVGAEEGASAALAAAKGLKPQLTRLLEEFYEELKQK